MATAEHREPCDSRGSRTVLGAPGGEIPPGDSTTAVHPYPVGNRQQWVESGHSYRLRELSGRSYIAASLVGKSWILLKKSGRN